MDADYYNDISDKIQDPIKDKYNRVLQSTVLYVIAYFIVTYSSVSVSGLVAKLMGFTPVIKYFGLYKMPVSPSMWTRWSILFVYGSGPLFALILSILCYRINYITREFNTLWKALCLWISVHGVCLFFAYFITSSFGTGNPYSPFYYAFAVIASWMYIDPVLMVPFTIIGIVGIIMFGLNVVVPFLSLCFSRQLAINYSGRRGFLVQVAVIPWLLGSIITIVVSLPPNPAMRDVVMNVSKNAVIAFMMLGLRFKMDHIVSSIQVHSFDVFKRSPTVILVAALLMVLFIQQRWIFQFLHIFGL